MRFGGAALVAAVVVMSAGACSASSMGAGFGFDPGKEIKSLFPSKEDGKGSKLFGFGDKDFGFGGKHDKPDFKTGWDWKDKDQHEHHPGKGDDCEPEDPAPVPLPAAGLLMLGGLGGLAALRRRRRG